MPRKKNSQTTPIKTPTPVTITSTRGPASPHILDLRLRSNIFLTKKTTTHTPSFEEKIAVFDERLKEIPDLLNVHADQFSKLLNVQKNHWHSSVATFINKSSAWGKAAHIRFRQVTKKRPALFRKKSYPNRLTAFFRESPRLPKIFRHEQFGLFLILLILLTIPLQGLALYRFLKTTQLTVTENLVQTKTHLRALTDELEHRDIAGARTELALGINGLNQLRKTVDHFGPLQYFLPARLRLNVQILRLGEAAGLSAQQILENVSGLQDGSRSFSQALLQTRAEITLLMDKLKPNRKDALTQAAFSPWYEQLKTADDLLAVLAYFSGGNDAKHILLVFQNPRELRATGGFMGSMALLTVRDGKIQTAEVPPGGTYAVQGQLTERKISPAPLHLINPRFELQDANWWPDFPTSAKKITELYEAAGGPTLDGVIAITGNAASQVLTLGDPLTIASKNSALDATNFLDTLEEIIASDRAADQKNPKKIITLLFPEMTKTLQTLLKSKPVELLGTISNSLTTKDIQLWSKDEATAAALRRLGFDGTLSPTSGDYLAVINANVGGGKTDALVNQEIFRDVKISDQSILTANLKIQRTHNGQKGNLRNGARNISYLRVYLPRGARFISASGFSPPPAHLLETPDATLTPDPQIRAQEIQTWRDPKSGTEIWEENGKAVFGNWITVDAGKTTAGVIYYALDLPKDNLIIPYRFTAEPQAGVKVKLKNQLTLAPQMHLVTAEGPGIWQPTGWDFDGTLKEPLIADGIFRKF